MASAALWSGALPANADTTVSTESELREALADPGTATLTLGASITLSDCNAGGGDLDRDGALTLDGAGFTITQTCPGERVLESTSGVLTLKNVTITGGDQSGDGMIRGGGVLAADDLVLNDTTVSGNMVTGDSSMGSMGSGGGTGAAFGGGVEAEGAITVVSSHVDNNVSSSNIGSYGAGILGGAGHDVTITDSTVEGNTAETTDATPTNSGANGGGVALVANDNSSSTILNRAGTVHVVRSSVSDNATRTQASGLTLAVAGGIAAEDVVLESSHVDANELHPTSTGGQAAGWGGGILADTITANSSTFDRNFVDPDGPDESARGGAALASSVALTDSTARDNTLTSTDAATCAALSGNTTVLSRSIISNNQASGTGVAVGGGLCAEQATVETSMITGNSAESAAGRALGGGGFIDSGEVRDSTVSGNSVVGATARGGGIVHGNDTVAAHDLALVNTTVTGNAAQSAAGSSGGVEQGAFGTLTLVFSTVAGNSATTGANLGATANATPVTSFASTISNPHGA